MARSKRLIPFLLTLVFAAILVRGGHRVRNKVLRELGLTPPCVKRVVATCHVSPVEIKTDRESFVKMVEKIAETEQCITEIKNDLHSLNRLEQKSKEQETALSEIKDQLQSLNRLEQKNEKQENARSDIRASLQSLNKLEQKSEKQEKVLSEIKDQLQSLNRIEEKNEKQENALSEIKDQFQSLNKLEQRSKGQEEAFSEIKANLQSLNRLEQKNEKQENALSEIKDQLQSLNRLGQKNEKQENALSEIKNQLQSLNRLEQKNEKQENALSEIKDQLQSLNKLEQKSEKQEDALSEIKDQLQSLNKLELKSKGQENTLSDIRASPEQALNKVRYKPCIRYSNFDRASPESLNKLEQKISQMKENEDSNHAQIFLLEEMVTNLQNQFLPTSRNCAELQKQGDNESGVRTVYPLTVGNDTAVTVFCDQTTDGGGWTLFQRRDALPKREDFFRGWHDYQTGFGTVSGEFWLGLDNIHALANATHNELYVSLENFEGEMRWAKYDTFSIDDADGKYRLHVEGYSGNAGDSLFLHNGMMFSTKDQDNDEADWGNCAQLYHGAWWYKHCQLSNLNGFQLEGKHGSDFVGINWYDFGGYEYSLKTTEMKVRPKVQN